MTCALKTMICAEQFKRTARDRTGFRTVGVFFEVVSGT